MYSLLSDDLCWLLIGYSILDALFLMWLFPCLVVLRVSVFLIADWLLFVWTCVRNHNLAACHFHSILYNWYISVICLDICQKSQYSFLVELKPKLLSFWSFHVPYVSANSSHKYYTTPTFWIGEYLHFKTGCPRYFAKIFVNFMWFSVKNKRNNSIKK